MTSADLEPFRVAAQTGCRYFMVLDGEILAASVCGIPRSVAKMGNDDFDLGISAAVASTHLECRARRMKSLHQRYETMFNNRYKDVGSLDMPYWHDPGKRMIKYADQVRELTELAATARRVGGWER